MSDELRTVNVVLSATANYYTGAEDGPLRRATGVVMLQPGHSESFPNQSFSNQC